MLTEKDLEVINFLRDNNYLRHDLDLFELTEEDKEMGYATVTEKLDDELSVERGENHMIINPHTGTDTVVFFNDEGIREYFKEKLTYDIEEKETLISIIEDYTNGFKEMMKDWGVDVAPIGDYQVAEVKQASVKKTIASYLKEFDMTNKKTAAGSGIGKYRRGEVLMDVTSVSPGQLLVLDSIKYKATDMIKVTQTFKDKFYAVFVSPENPVELKSKGDEEFVVYPEELKQGEYYIALEPAPTEPAPEVEDVETGVKEPAEPEAPEAAPEETSVKETTEVTKEVPEEETVVKETTEVVKEAPTAASKKTAVSRGEAMPTEPAQIQHDGYPYYITPIDTTHVYFHMEQDKKGTPLHVGQLPEGLSDDVYKWLGGDTAALKESYERTASKKTAEVGASDLGFLADKWRAKGAEAGNTDGWMTPTIDELSDEELSGEITQIMGEEEQGWESTDHFQQLYGVPMSDDAERYIGKHYEGDNPEEAALNTQQELISAFWEGWESSSGIYDMIKEERSKKGITAEASTEKEAIKSPVREKMDYGEMPFSAEERQKEIKSKLDKLNYVSEVDLDAYADSGETVKVTLNSNQTFSGVIEKEEAGRYFVYASNEAKVGGASPISPQFKEEDVSYIGRVSTGCNKLAATDLPESMVDSYLATALWSSSDRDPDDPEREDMPLDEKYSIEDVSEESRVRAQKDVDVFLKKAKDIISKIDSDYVLDEAMAGHDFWLTRNSHGAGFWDGDYPDEIGEALTELSDEFGGVDAVIGDDGKIYLEGGKDIEASTEKTADREYEEEYVEYLNEMGIPDLDLESEGGRIPDGAQYGDWLRENDPIAFNVGLNEYEQEKGLKAATEKTAEGVGQGDTGGGGDEPATAWSNPDANPITVDDPTHASPDMTYEEFSKKYREAFENMMTYSPDEAGSLQYADEMAKLHDEYPEWAEMVENEALSASVKKEEAAPPTSTPFSQYAADTKTAEYEEEVEEEVEEETGPTHELVYVEQSDEDEDEDIFTGPTDDDIVIGEGTGQLGTGPYPAFYAGKQIAEANDLDELAGEIAEWMETQQYWPNVWLAQERGDVSLMSIQKKGALDNFEVEQERMTSGDYHGTVGSQVSTIKNLFANTETLASPVGGEGDDGSAYDLLEEERNFTGVDEDVVTGTVEEYLNGKATSLATFEDFCGYVGDIYGIKKDASIKMAEAWHNDDQKTLVAFIKENATQDLLK